MGRHTEANTLHVCVGRALAYVGWPRPACVSKISMLGLGGHTEASCICVYLRVPIPKPSTDELCRTYILLTLTIRAAISQHR